MKNISLKVAPDYLPLSVKEFIRHFSNLLTTKNYNLWKRFNKYTKILGYSCRSLFETCLDYFAKDDLVIATTPLHHTSFKEIIEKYVKPENIHVIQLNEKYNGISELPQIVKCDLVIITHIFGQDMDLSSLADFKKKHNCIIIEDRVQGGTLERKFSSELADISIYSMAMDKRPIALGGGFMYVKNEHSQIIQSFIESIEKLPQEKTSARFKDLVKKIPTFLLYNWRVILFVFISMLNLLNCFNKKINILNVGKYYRANNPGFVRKGFMMKPSKGLLKSMYENFHKHKKIENLFKKNYDYFMDCLSPMIIRKHFPWYKGDSSLTPYNTMILGEKLVNPFLEFLNKHNISALPNPTYKALGFPFKNNLRYVKFSNKIVYLPCLVNMTKNEIIFLSKKIKEFFKIYQ